MKNNQVIIKELQYTVMYIKIAINNLRTESLLSVCDSYAKLLRRKERSEKAEETGLHNPQVCHTLFLSTDKEKSTSSYFAVRPDHMSSLN